MQSDSELVLVVDDSQEVITCLTDTVLSHGGYRSVSATTGAEALHIINEQHPDVILLDIELPDVNGLSLVEQLRRQEIKTPVVIMAAYGCEEKAVRALRLGVRDYVIKPYPADQVVDAIRDALYLSHLEQEKERLTRQLQQQTQELTAREQMGRSVAALLDLDTLLSRIVEASVFITGAEEGFLLLLDEETNELTLRAARNLGEEHAHLLGTKVKDNLAEQVVNSGQPLRLGVEEDAGGGLAVATGYLVRALLYVPLVTQGRVLGVSAVDNRTTRQTFSQDDLERLVALADYAAIALQNARLYGALKERAAYLETAYADLQELSQLKTEFVQDVSHELRVPLTFIKGYVDLLREGAFGEIGPAQLEPLAIVADQTERVTRLVDQVLTLQRLESGNLELTQVNLIEMAYAAIDGARAAAQRAGLVIKEEIPETLSPIIGEPDQLAQIFDNLLSNAIKFSPYGGTVTVCIQELRDWVNVYVSDTGIGIPADELDRLFVRFYRGGELSGKRVAGSGLGLAIVKAVVEAHGGQVAVRSRDNEGSTFSFSLPKAGPDAGPADLRPQLDGLDP